MPVPNPTAPHTFSYYPNQDYIDKNLAPEKYPAANLEILAKAQAKAEKLGILSPETARYMLANALVEGPKRATDFGVNGIDEHAPEGSKVRKIFDTMGLTQVASEAKNRAAQWNTFITNTSPAQLRANVMIQNESKDRLAVTPKTDSVEKGMTFEDIQFNADLAATILGIKASKGGAPEDAIRRWNGAGKGAENHLAKVQRTMEMLNHPKNAAIMRFYQQALGME